MADTVLGEITDWIYSQIVGFLGNFFGEMGSMGAELFQMSWVQSIVLFFSYLAWALYATGLVVSCFECGIEYTTGRGNVREVFLNGLKGFLAVNLFTVVPVRLYELSVSLQSELTRGLTGYGSSIGDVAQTVLEDYSAIEKLSEITEGSLPGFGMISSALMVIFCLILILSFVLPGFLRCLWSIAILLAFGYTSLAKGGKANGSEEKSLRHDPGSAAQPAPAGAGAAGPDPERLCGKAHQRTF